MKVKRGKIFKEVITINFLNIMETLKSQIQESLLNNFK